MTSAAPRIASLVPSLTELLVALGLRDHLVARTGFCVHPAEAVRAIPKVGGTKDVNLAKLRRLAPTHVLVNVDENRRDTVEAIAAWPPAQRPQLVVTHPVAPEDNVALIRQMLGQFGHVEGVAARAAALIGEIDHELATTQPERYAPCGVLYLVWRDPWMTVARDTYIARMLARVNWRTLPAVEGGEHGAARYPVVRGDEPWLADVDRVLLSSEPYAFGPRHVDEARALCPGATVQFVDGELVSWYGPRAAAGLRYLRGLAG
jgi:ABC-type Fe3+-hydroxamate transport system substrate-binding protein